MLTIADHRVGAIVDERCQQKPDLSEVDGVVGVGHHDRVASVVSRHLGPEHDGSSLSRLVGVGKRSEGAACGRQRLGQP